MRKQCYELYQSIKNQIKKLYKLSHNCIRTYLTSCQCFLVFLIIIIYIIIGYLLSYYFLSAGRPVDEVSDSKSSDHELYSLNLYHDGTLKVIDSNPASCSGCSEFRHNFTCSQIKQDNITHMRSCSHTLELFSDVNFPKLSISCPSGKCDVNFDSNYFNSGDLFVYGEKISMKASKLSAKNFFFDTVEGNLFIELFNGDSASASTTRGDIAIQTLKETKLSTFSSTKSVCVSSEQGWKDSATKISNLEEVFDVKDPQTQSCFDVYSYQDRNYAEMIETSKHVFFDSLKQTLQSEPFESRCISITDVLLLRSQSDAPSSISSFTTIRTATSEGNIYINVLSNVDLDENSKSVPPTAVISNPISNNQYDMSNLGISETWVKQLNDTFRDIQSQGKLNEIVFLNFGEKDTRELQWLVLFTPLYLHFSPKWISLFSLYILSSKQEEFMVGLRQGFCPYIFRYSESEGYLSSDPYIKDSKLLLSSRRSVVQGILDSFFSEIEVEPYISMVYQDYFDLKVTNIATYPDSKDISSSMKIVIFGEMLFFWVLYLSFNVIPSYIFSKIKEVVKNQEKEFKIRIMFYIQQMLKNKNPKSESYPKLSQIQEKIQQQPNEKYLESHVKNLKIDYHPSQVIKNNLNRSHNVNIYFLVSQTDNNQGLNLAHPSNNISDGDNLNFNPILDGANQKLVIVLENDNLCNYTFQELVSDGASWVQKRWMNSLELFYSLLFVLYDVNQNEIKNEENGIVTTNVEVDNLKEENVVLQFEELQQWYQHFCFQYNLPQQNILRDESILLLQDYGFEINYEKRIVFHDNEQLQKDWKNIKLTFEPAVSEYFQKIDQVLPQIPEKGYISLSYFVFLAQQRFKEQRNGTLLTNSVKYSNYKSELKSNLLKLSPNLVLSRKRKSNFILNSMLLIQMKQELGMNALKIQKTNNDTNVLKFELQDIQGKELIKYKDRSDSKYLSRIYFAAGNKISTHNIKYFLQSVINTLVYLSTPVLLLIFQIIGIFVSLKEMEKTYERKSIDENDIIWGVIQYKELSIPLVTSIVFSLFFIFQHFKKRFFTLSNDNKIPFNVKLDLIENIPPWEADRKDPRRNKINFTWFYVKFNTILLGVLLLFLIFYILATSSILIIGSIMIPSVSLPSIVFLAALVTVIVNQVQQFISLREMGESKLIDCFKNNFQSNFENLKEQNADFKTQLEEKSKNYQERNWNNHREFNDIFIALVDSAEDTITSESFSDLFNMMEIKISQQHLDQMFAHAKVAVDLKIKTIYLGDKNLLRLNRKEFQVAINYFLQLKVQQALNILNISFIQLILTIINLIMQSFLIMALVYCVFKGFSATGEPFIFSVENIASIAGVFGILFSNREKQAKQLEDETTIQNIVQEVEEIFHGKDIRIQKKKEED